MLTRPQLEKLWAYGRSLKKTQRMQRYVIYKSLLFCVGNLTRTEHELFMLSGRDSAGLTDNERAYLRRQYEELRKTREKCSALMVRLQHSSAWGQKP